MIPSLPGWTEVLYDEYTYLRGLLFVLIINSLCGASALRSIKLQRNLVDTSVRESTLESVNLFFKWFVIISYSTKIVLGTDRSLYYINIFVQIILSLIYLPPANYLTFNFNSLIFFKNSH